MVEMAIVLVILGFVISAMLLPISAQREQNFRLQTDNQLVTAQTALIGFAQRWGRLPCPATDASNGLEDPVGGSTSTVACTVEDGQDGFLPAVTLGIRPVNSDGYAVDGWGNPIRYAVTQTDADGAGGADFTTINEMNKVTIASLNPDLRVYDNSGNFPGTYLINNAVAVVYSTGQNGPTAVGDDEEDNLDGDRDFFSRVPTDAAAAGGFFDDHVIWISPYILYNAMIEAGQLH